MDILNQGYLSNMGERGYKELCPPLIGFVRDNTHLNFMIKAKHGIEFYSTQNKYEADLKVCDMTAKAIQNIDKFAEMLEQVPRMPAGTFIFTNDDKLG